MPDKLSKYKRIEKQLAQMFTKILNPISRMATVAALLHHKFSKFYWTGFYLFEDRNLIIGPYQGTLACMVLTKHTGVCWSAVDREKSIIVPDVHKFPGHIACDEKTNSEIVVLMKDPNGVIKGVLDIDSTDFDSFDENDLKGLEKIVKLIYQ